MEEKDNKELNKDNLDNNQNEEEKNNSVDNNFNDKNQADEETLDDEKDTRSFSEKIEDAVDDIVYDTQRIIYGDIDNFSENIPAMMRDPDNEIRHINKVQTRRNFNKWLFGKKGYKVLLALFGIALAIGLIVSFVG